MTNEQENHMVENVMAFQQEYVPKYTNGQKEHSGNMWTMGAYQVLENMEDEVLDQWSYARQIRLCLDQIKELCQSSVEVDSKDILEILNRTKED